MTFKVLLIYVFSFLLTRMSIFLLGQRLQLSEVVFLILFLLWFRDLIKNKRLPQCTGLSKPFLLFIILCLPSFFHSSNLFLSTAELLGLIYLFVMLVLTVDIVDSKRRLDIVIKFWIGTLAMVLALGFIGWCICAVTGKSNLFCRITGNFPYLKTAYRIQSIFHNPLDLANYLIISLGFVVSEFLLTENKRYKAFLKVMIFFSSLIIIATVTREIFAFMFSAFLIYNYFHKVKNLKFRIVRFFSVSLIIIMFVFMTILCSSFYIRSYKIENFSEGTHKKLLVNVDYAYSVKLAYEIAALEMVKRHPFLGVGLKMYRPYLQRLNNENYFRLKNLTPIHSYAIDRQYLDYLPVNDPHNDILQYFAETGIFGGTAFVLFIATFLYLIFTNLRKRKDDRYFKVRLFCFGASFIGILIESMDLDVFKLRPVWFLMALSMALIMMHKDRAGKRDQIDEKD